MIGSVTIRVSAGRPNMPVGPVAIIQGSACTIGVLDVPRRRFGVEITRVAVSVCNGVGTTSNVPAKFECGVWTATFDASLFSQPGSVENGVKVFCGGKDENGVEREWTIGVGDVEILSAGEVPVPAPGETWQNVHLRDEEPETPIKGDLFKFDDGWKIFDGEEWQSIGGGGGGAVSSVNDKTGAVVLTGKDIKTSDDPDAYTITDKIDSDFETLMEHIGSENNPHNVTAEQVGAATKGDLIVRLDLVGDGSATSPYVIQLDGGVQTFDQIKVFAETRNAVIRHGQGTYRVTYIGATEMMWDVTGMMQGNVLTGQIHIFYQDGATVVQRVEPKVLATKPMVDAVDDKVDEIKSTVSTDNRFLVNGTTAAIQTRESEDAEWTDEIRIDKGYDALQGSTMVKLDKSVQTVTVAGGTLTVELPDAVEGTVRDLCLYVNNTTSASEVTITFPTGITVYKSKGGDNPKMNAQAGGITAYYFTEMPGEGWRVVRDELEVAT